MGDADGWDGWEAAAWDGWHGWEADASPSQEADVVGGGDVEVKSPATCEASVLFSFLHHMEAKGRLDEGMRQLRAANYGDVVEDVIFAFSVEKEKEEEEEAKGDQQEEEEEAEEEEGE